MCYDKCMRTAPALTKEAQLARNEQVMRTARKRAAAMNAQIAWDHRNDETCVYCTHLTLEHNYDGCNQCGCNHFPQEG